MNVRWNSEGLAPAVVVDAATGEVLMLAWMNAESLARTLETCETWFWSRRRGELWHKGASSGNTQAVVTLGLDCDDDALCIRVRPRGPACHRDTPTCWDVPTGGAAALLDATLRRRKAELPEGSYSTRLLTDENLRIKKVGEEAAEFIHAALTGTDERAAEEAADLLFHVAAVLHARGLSLADALRVLDKRSMP